MSNRLEPTSRNYDEKLQRILKISAKIFAEKGFHRTSVRDICARHENESGGTLLLLYDQRRIALSYPRTVFRYACYSVGNAPRRLIWTCALGFAIFAENHLSFFCHNMHEMKVMAHEDESLTGEFQVKILVLKAPLRKSDHGSYPGTPGSRRWKGH